MERILINTNADINAGCRGEQRWQRCYVILFD